MANGVTSSCVLPSLSWTPCHVGTEVPVCCSPRAEPAQVTRASSSVPSAQTPVAHRRPLSLPAAPCGPVGLRQPGQISGRPPPPPPPPRCVTGVSWWAPMDPWGFPDAPIPRICVASLSLPCCPQILRVRERRASRGCGPLQLLSHKPALHVPPRRCSSFILRREAAGARECRGHGGRAAGEGAQEHTLGPGMAGTVPKWGQVCVAAGLRPPTRRGPGLPATQAQRRES